MAMKRPDAGGAPHAGQGARDEVLHGWLPSVHEHLTEQAWDDGKPRKTSTLMLLTENGRWKAFLHDRDAKRGCWVTGDAWEGVLEALERALKDSSTEWRRDTR